MEIWHGGRPSPIAHRPSPPMKVRLNANITSLRSELACPCPVGFKINVEVLIGENEDLKFIRGGLTTDLGTFAIKIVEGIIIEVAEGNWGQIELLGIVVSEVVDQLRNGPVLIWCLGQSHSASCKIKIVWAEHNTRNTYIQLMKCLCTCTQWQVMGVVNGTHIVGVSIEMPSFTMTSFQSARGSTRVETLTVE